MTEITWDEIMRKQQWGRYPNEMVVREVMGFKQRHMHHHGGIGTENIPALDLGCGGGAHTMLLAENGFFVTAVDSSREALHQTEVNCLRRGLDNKVRYVELDYIAGSLPLERHCVIIDWLSLTHAPRDKVHSVVWRVFNSSLGSQGRYILGVFGPDTDQETFEGRPPALIWARQELEALASQVAGAFKGGWHLEEQTYTRKGKQTQIWCLVIDIG
jgi:SAM-dependent methyltransferase